MQRSTVALHIPTPICHGHWMTPSSFLWTSLMMIGFQVIFISIILDKPLLGPRWWFCSLRGGGLYQDTTTLPQLFNLSGICSVKGCSVSTAVCNYFSKNEHTYLLLVVIQRLMPTPKHKCTWPSKYYYLNACNLWSLRWSTFVVTDLVELLTISLSKFHFLNETCTIPILFRAYSFH